MPIYEYACQACGHELESIQKMSDPPLTDCPACGKPALKKMISAAGFVLKGGGWYATDFRDKGKKKDDAKNVTQEKGAKEKGAQDTKEAAKDDAPKPAAGCGSGGCDACTD